MNKRKFFKVYSGPGYPIDLKADQARRLDHFIDDVLRGEYQTEFANECKRTFNYSRLNQWMLNTLN